MHFYLFNIHELGQTLGDGEGQRSLACCTPWGHEEWDTTQRLNNNLLYMYTIKCVLHIISICCIYIYCIIYIYYLYITIYVHVLYMSFN